MGNVHALSHRVTALSMACLSSAGLILAVLAGLNCSFLAITAEPDRNLMNPDGVELASIDVVQAGVLCDESEFYDPDDKMWDLSQLFFYISTALGAATTMLAWAISTCLPPTVLNWRVLSLLASITAVIEVPIFLIFEIDSCNMDTTRQKCSLDLGSYFLIASVAMWVLMTLWTHYLDPPRWSDEINAWVTSKRATEGLEFDGTDASTERGGSPLSLPTEAAQQAFFVSTRNNNSRLAIRPVGIDEEPLADDDDDMSSVSDESVSEGKDLEKGKHQGENKNVRPTDPNDAAIRKGVEWLQMSGPTNEKCSSPQPTGNNQSPNSRKEKKMRNNSNLTEHGPGPRLTIASPDVTQKDTAMAQPSSCFVNEAEVPDWLRLDIPAKTPTVGTENFRGENTLITPNKQCSRKATSVQDSKPTGMKDPISISGDSTETPLPVAGM
jgi:hypothetical protein